MLYRRKRKDNRLANSLVFDIGLRMSQHHRRLHSGFDDTEGGHDDTTDSLSFAPPTIEDETEDIPHHSTRPWVNREGVPPPPPAMSSSPHVKQQQTPRSGVRSNRVHQSLHALDNMIISKRMIPRLFPNHYIPPVLFLLLLTIFLFALITGFATMILVFIGFLIPIYYTCFAIEEMTWLHQRRMEGHHKNQRDCESCSSFLQPVDAIWLKVRAWFCYWLFYALLTQFGLTYVSERDSTAFIIIKILIMILLIFMAQDIYERSVRFLQEYLRQANEMKHVRNAAGETSFRFTTPIITTSNTREAVESKGTDYQSQLIKRRSSGRFGGTGTA